MSRIPLAVLFFVSWFTPLVYAWQQPQPDELASPTLRIGWDAFKKLYDAGTVVLIDVRGAESFEAGHIPRARNIPLNDIEKQAPSLKKLRKPIVLYCA